MKAVDIIIAGHLHNGYVPNQIEELFKKQIRDYGVWEKPGILPPRLFAKIDLCRGMHELGESKLVVSKGVRPFTGYVPAGIPIIPNITVIDIAAKTK